MTDASGDAKWNVVDWHGKMPQVTATKEQVRSAPEIELHGEELSQADESSLYHHFEMNYTPIATQSGRRLARR